MVFGIEETPIVPFNKKVVGCIGLPRTSFGGLRFSTFYPISPGFTYVSLYIFRVLPIMEKETHEPVRR